MENQFPQLTSCDVFIADLILVPFEVRRLERGERDHLLVGPVPPGHLCERPVHDFLEHAEEGGLVGDLEPVPSW